MSVGYALALFHSWYTIATQLDYIERKGPRDLKGDNVFEVKEIKADKEDYDGRPMYLISWKGYGSDQDTWEYAGNISYAALKAYRVGRAERGEKSRSRRRSSLLNPEKEAQTPRSRSRRRSSTPKVSSTRRRSSTARANKI